MAAALLFFTPINDLLALTQHLIHGRAIRRTKLAGPPVFILGHWRSGTTMMHELLQLDDRFASPNTYQCFAPWHFLLTERLICRFGNFLLPDKRPMDNMKVGWSLPQEDEFALMVLGAPTPYYRVAFPRHPVPHMDSLGSQSFKPRDLERWKKDIDWFFRALTYHTGKPLIIKSPPHTGRLGILAEMYPDAKFIHMVRDPRKLYPSTKKMWRALGEVQSLQKGDDEENLHRYVIDCLHRMYDSFEIDRRSLPSNRIIDIRYEELVKQPAETVESIYQQLELGDAKSLGARIRERQASDVDYQVNQHQTNDELEKIVQRDWADYLRRYGY
jgi:omega-hydroxy-beta-dihydromenaquinone-9 sulfotransferase